MKSIKSWSRFERLSYSLASLMLVCMVGGALSVGFGILKSLWTAIMFGFGLWVAGFFFLLVLLIMRLYERARKKVHSYWRGVIILVGAGVGLFILARMDHPLIATLLVFDVVLLICFAYFYPLLVTFKPRKQWVNS
jgi:hypothetical protein